MKKIFTIAAAVLFAGSMMAAEPTLETMNWGADDFATVIANHDGITLSTDATAWGGNFSGTQYIALGSSCDITSPQKYIAVSATNNIDSIEVYWAPNGTDASNLAWVAWTDAANLLAQDVNFYGETAEFTGSKSIEGATWQKIDLSDNEVKAIMVARQIKNAKLDESKLSNFGKNKTVNILGIRVWLASSTPSTDPVASVEIAGPEEIYVGKAAAYTATTDVKATEYKWFVNDVEQEGATTKSFEYTPEAEGTFSIVCKAQNENNTEWAVSNTIELVASVKPAATACAELYPAAEGPEAAQYAAVALKEESFGGSIIFADAKDGNYAASFLYTEYGLQMCKGGKDSVRVVLNNEMEVGTLIQIKVYQVTIDNKTRGFKLQNLAKSTKLDASWVPQPDGTAAEDAIVEKTYEYEVVANDGLAGTNAFIIARNNSAVLESIIVSGCGAELPTAIDNTEDAVKAVKVVRNGQLFIEKNGVIYNAQGAVVK